MRGHRGHVAHRRAPCAHERIGGAHELVVDVPGSRGLGGIFSRGAEVRLVVQCPAGAELEAQGGSADIRAAGRYGAVEARTGSGDVEIAEVDVRPGDQWLQRLYVDRAFQGRGLGRRLLDAALVHPRLALAHRVYLTVWEENEPALRLYRSAGFRPVGTTAFRIGDGPLVEDLVLVLER
jgi:ribosomal protein S18 acetylase RimI-like enzyme